MPTYDYRCTVCDHRYELVQKMSDPPRKRCPKCGRKAERLIGAGAGLLFKGSGFYITDYRSREYQAKAKAESSSTGGTADGAKPAADTASSSKESSKTGQKDGQRDGPKESPKPSGGGSEGGSEGGHKDAAKKGGKSKEGTK